METYFRSLDSGNEQQALDLKRQLQVIEQEATVLRTKTQTLESDNEKLAAENKQLHLQRIKKWPLEAENETALKAEITSLETKLSDANSKVIQCILYFHVDGSSYDKASSIPLGITIDICV